MPFFRICALKIVKIKVSHAQPHLEFCAISVHNDLLEWIMEQEGLEKHGHS